MKNGFPKFLRFWCSVLAFFCFFSVEAQESNFSERLEKLERTMSTAGLIDLVEQIEALQKEVRVQRGDIENLQFQLQKSLNNGGIIRSSSSEVSAGSEGKLEEAVAKEALPSSVPDPASISPQLKGANNEEPVPLVNGEKSYRAAFGLLKAGKYQEAINGFNSYLSQNPKAEYSDNSQFWLGEAYYVLQDYVKAIEQYGKLIQEFPDSKKSSHAMLKTGYCYEKLGDKSEAIKVLSELRRRFPDSAAARLALTKIEKLQSE